MFKPCSASDGFNFSVLCNGVPATSWIKAVLVFSCTLSASTLGLTPSSYLFYDNKI